MEGGRGVRREGGECEGRWESVKVVNELKMVDGSVEGERGLWSEELPYRGRCSGLPWRF